MADTAYATGENSMAQKWVDAYNDAKRIRMPLEADWRNVARYGLPRHYGGWTTTNATPTASGAGASRQARIDSYDSTLGRAIRMYQAVCERMLTPGTQKYHMLMPVEDRPRKSRAVMLWLYQLNEKIFQLRYNAYARFVPAQGETYVSLGAYGNGAKLLTWRDADRRFGRSAGYTYRNIPFRNMFWRADANEILNTWFRRIDWTAKQAKDELGDKCPQDLKDKVDSKAGSETTYEFFQVVTPSEDYDDQAFDRRRYPLVSLYIYVGKPQIVREPKGFKSNPLITPRDFTEGGRDYGFGGAQSVLSSVGSVNAQVKTLLRYGQRTAEPILLTHDDGIMNGKVDLVPGSNVPGGIDSQGRVLVKSLELGNLQVNENLIEMTRDDIRDPLFGRIFDQIKDRPQRTATEVLDDLGREASMLAPTMGRYQAEDLEMMIEREISLLKENNALPPDMPAELNDIEFKPIYTSPMAKAMHAEGVSGYMRTLEIALNYAQQTGKTQVLNHFNLEVALPEIADNQGAPAPWMNDPETVAHLNKADEDRQKQEMMLKAAPAAASVAKTVADNNMQQPAAASNA